jgi:uncharacterized protein (TIGR03067 family)
MRFTLTALALLASVAAAAPVPKALKAKPTLDGRWELVEQNYQGKNQPDFPKWMWVIDGEKLTYCRPDQGGKYVPSETNVRAALTRAEGGSADDFDYVYNSGPNATVYKSVVVRDGDELVVCFGTAGNNGARPSEAKPGADRQYFRFKRATDK